MIRTSSLDIIIMIVSAMNDALFVKIWCTHITISSHTMKWGHFLLFRMHCCVYSYFDNEVMTRGKCVYCYCVIVFVWPQVLWMTTVMIDDSNNAAANMEHNIIMFVPVIRLIMRVIWIYDTVKVYRFQPNALYNNIAYYYFRRLLAQIRAY